MGDVDRADVMRQLSRWVASGKLVQLRRGLYAFAGSQMRGLRTPGPYEIANRLVPGSYVSLSSVLARAGLIPSTCPLRRRSRPVVQRDMLPRSGRSCTGT